MLRLHRIHVAYSSINNQNYSSLSHFHTLQNSPASGSQTCSSRYPIQGRNYVLLPSIFCVIKRRQPVYLCLYCGFGSALPPKEAHITPGVHLPPLWEPLVQTIKNIPLLFPVRFAFFRSFNFKPKLY